MFRRFLRHKVIRDKGLLLIFAKPPLFPRLLPGTFVGNVNLGLMGQQDRWQTGQGKSPKKSKIKRKITIKKRIKSTMKIKSRTSGTRPRNAGRPALPRVPALAPALALSPLPDLTLHLSLAPCGPLVNPPIED